MKNMEICIFMCHVVIFEYFEDLIFAFVLGNILTVLSHTDLKNSGSFPSVGKLSFLEWK